MSPTNSDFDELKSQPKSNVYTILLVLSFIFLAGGITLIYLKLMPYLPG